MGARNIAHALDLVLHSLSSIIIIVGSGALCPHPLLEFIWCMLLKRLFINFIRINQQINQRNNEDGKLYKLRVGLVCHTPCICKRQVSFQTWRVKSQMCWSPVLLFSVSVQINLDTSSCSPSLGGGRHHDLRPLERARARGQKEPWSCETPLDEVVWASSPARTSLFIVCQI